MTVLAQLSDPHVGLGPGDTGSAEALAAAVDAVLRLDPPPDAVLVSGDLTNGSDARSYERVRELLAPLPMPVHVLPGNHDDREALRAWFTEDTLAGAHGDPFHYAVRCGALRLVVCDTTIPGRPDGRLDAGALAWLEGELAAEPDVPTIVAMHHAPLLTGIAGDGRDRAAGRRPRRARARCSRGSAGCAASWADTCTARASACSAAARCSRARARTCSCATTPAPEIDLEPAPPAFALHAMLAGGEVVTLVQPVGSGA